MAVECGWVAGAVVRWPAPTRGGPSPTGNASNRRRGTRRRIAAIPTESRSCRGGPVFMSRVAASRRAVSDRIPACP